MVPSGPKSSSLTFTALVESTHLNVAPAGAMVPCRLFSFSSSDTSNHPAASVFEAAKSSALVMLSRSFLNLLQDVNPESKTNSHRAIVRNNPIFYIF